MVFMNADVPWRSLGVTVFVVCVLVAWQSEVRSQDTVFVIAGATRTVDGREMVWKFVRDNWTMLHERYHGIFLLARLVKVRRSRKVARYYSSTTCSRLHDRAS